MEEDAKYFFKKEMTKKQKTNKQTTDREKDDQIEQHFSIIYNISQTNLFV